MKSSTSLLLFMALFIGIHAQYDAQGAGGDGRAHGDGRGHGGSGGHGDGISHGDGIGHGDDRGHDDGRGHHDVGGHGDGRNFAPSHHGGKYCDGIYKKKVTYGYQKGYKYSQGKSYRDGYFRRYCRAGPYYAKNYGSYGNQQCSNYGYTGGYGKHDQCYDTKCDVSLKYGYSRCHGKVRLSHAYYYYGKECRYEGYHCGRYGYGGHGYGGYGGYGQTGYGVLGGYGRRSGYGNSNGYGKRQCYCKTYFCYYSIKACYYYYGQYYEDFVYVKIPCGCSCYRRKYIG